MSLAEAEECEIAISGEGRKLDSAKDGESTGLQYHADCPRAVNHVGTTNHKLPFGGYK